MKTKNEIKIGNKVYSPTDKGWVVEVSVAHVTIAWDKGRATVEPIINMVPDTLGGFDLRKQSPKSPH